jgi:hypothetical protein
MSSRPPDARVGDRAPDDWLGEETEVDWNDARRPIPSGGAATRRPDADASTVVARSGAPPAADARQRDVVQRRRAIGLVALLGLALVGVGVGLTVLRDDTPSTEPTTPTVAAPPPPATPPATTSTTPAETPATLRIVLPASGPLARGDRGEEVETLQTGLAALELYTGEVDGVFGEGTQSAVIAFQQANDLEADGIVGPATVRALNAELAEQGVTR